MIYTITYLCNKHIVLGDITSIYDMDKISYQYIQTFDLQLHPQLTYRMFENTTESLFYRFVICICIYDGKSI